jgi:hypothetical protein
MRLMGQVSIATIALLMALPLSAQDRGGRGGQRGERGGAPAAAAGGGAAPMTMTIVGFPDGAQIPVKFSQAAEGAAPGEGTSPAINWANPPAGTQTFMLNMHDMDVSRNKTTDDQAHWVVWNIPATATGLTEGQPKGAQLPNGAYQGQRHRPGLSRSGRSRKRSFSSLCFLSCSLWIRKSTSNPRPMPSRHAPT